MSAPEILNLDAIETSIEKTVVHNGQRHALRPFTVEDFINNLKEIDAYAAREEVSVQEFFEHTIRMIVSAFPTLPEAEVRAMPMPKLKALSDFVKGETKSEVEQAAAKGEIESPKELTDQST